MIFIHYKLRSMVLSIHLHFRDECQVLEVIMMRMEETAAVHGPVKDSALYQYTTLQPPYR